LDSSLPALFGPDFSSKPQIFGKFWEAGTAMDEALRNPFERISLAKGPPLQLTERVARLTQRISVARSIS